MSGDERSPLSEVLGYRDRVALRCTPLDGAPDAAQLAQWSEHNLRVLAAAASWDERPRHADADDPAAAELDRVHHKLDLILELLATLLRQQMTLPAETEAWITHLGVRWTPVTAPSPDRWLRLELHLQAGLPAPLIWPARASMAADGAVEARFADLGEACTLALQRHVFVRHRRSVAEARSPAA